MSESKLKRGFAMLGLRNPKSGENVGGACRAAHCYGAAGVIVDGKRRNKLMQHPTDTMKAYRHMPLQWVDDLFEAIPYACIPIAVELHPRARAIEYAKHPERAIYIFGAEDATLGKETIDRCESVIYVPTRDCMNLAATANVILFDRASKRREWPAYAPKSCALAAEPSDV